MYLLGLGLALVAGALAFTDWALSWRPGVTEANAKRIRKGMTLAEVRGLLGGRGVCYADASKLRHWVGGEAQRFFDWTGGEGRVWVGIDFTDRVTRFGFDRTAQRPSPLARLRAWLGW